MPRASNVPSNSILFGKLVNVSPAERILRALETAHDNWYLLEMNGERCAGRQISKLQWYDRPARLAKDRKEGQ